MSDERNSSQGVTHSVRESTHESAHSSEWLDRIQDLIDFALDEKSAADVATHVANCPDCRATHSKLTRVHERLAEELGNAPPLGADFSARVLARIDANEDERRAQAKRRAEEEYRRRMEAFGFDWREFWQRHLGSVFATLAVIGGSIAALGSVFSEVRAEVVAQMPWFQGSLPAVALGSSVAIAAIALLILRTKAR